MGNLDKCTMKQNPYKIQLKQKAD